MSVRGTRGGGIGRRAALALVCPALALAGVATAQVELDGSLGPSGPVPFDGTTWQITDDLGMRSGANLFHSFSLLDVPAGQIASFQLADASATEPLFVIARVTGGDASEIGGTLQSLHDGASLFLLNPHGFSFGPRSAVQALGSVYVSSADVLRFGTDQPFDARSSDPSQVLSAVPPTAFGFLGDAPAGIAFDLSTVRSPGTPPSDFDFPVPAGGTLAAVGGDILIRDAEAASGRVPAIRIEGGTLALAAVQKAGIDVPVEVASFDARDRAPGTLGEIRVERNAFLDVGSPGGSGVGSGRVVIRAGRLVVDDARIDAIAGSDVPGAPVAIDLEASESVEIRAGSRLTVTSVSAASGDLRIAAGDVRIAGLGTALVSTARGAGEAPDIALEADALAIEAGAQVALTKQASATAVGGGFSARAGTAAVSDAAVVLSRTQGAAAGGTIAFDVGALRVVGAGAVKSESSGGGPGGAIEIAAETLELATKGQIASENTGAGRGGAITVRAQREVALATRGKIASEATGAAANTGGDVLVEAGELIRVVGEDASDADVTQISALTSSTSLDGSGGNLRLAAPRIELRDAGQLRTTTSGAGQGGALEIADTDLLHVSGNAIVDGELVGAGLFARSTGSGAGGALEISAREVVVEDGGELSTRTFGAGQAGHLVIRDAKLVSVRGGPRGVSTLSTRGAQGAGGKLEINLRNARGKLVLASGGIVSASTVGAGDAGDLSIAADRIEISGALSGLFSRSTFGGSDSGDAGNVTIDAGRHFAMGRGASVATSALGPVSGGDIAISARGIVYVQGPLVATLVNPGGSGDGGNLETSGRMIVLNQSRIRTDAPNNGGDVTATAGDLLASQNAEINASGDVGVSGTIKITSPDADLAGQITPLPANFFDAAKLMTMACDARRARAGSFVVQTRKAIGPLPDAPLTPPASPPADVEQAGPDPSDPGCPG